MNKLIYGALLGVALAQLHGCAAVVVGGAATGAAAATDRRTTGVFVADQEIELRAMNRLREALPEKNRKDLRDQLQPPGAAHGQVPDESIRARATDVVKDVPDVRTVFNELSISGVTSLTSGPTTPLSPVTSKLACCVTSACPEPRSRW